METNDLLIILIILIVLIIIVMIQMFVFAVFGIKDREDRAKEIMAFTHNLIKRIAPQVPPIKIVQENIENLKEKAPKEKLQGKVYNPSRDIDRIMRGDRIDGFD